MKKIALFLSVVAILASCSKDDDLQAQQSFEQSEDYLIFGLEFGECYDCTQLFKIDMEHLYGSRYNVDGGWFSSEPVIPLMFNSTPESSQDHALAKVLLEEFPDVLIDGSKLSFGMPNAYDQGAIYLELTSNSRTLSWLIDYEEKNISPELQDYIRSAKSVLDQLR